MLLGCGVVKEAPEALQFFRRLLFSLTLFLVFLTHPSSLANILWITQ